MTKQDADLMACRFIRNVYALIKEKHIKVEYVEQQAGVSPGYISRLVKGDRVGGFTLQKAVLFADSIGENLNDLLTKDYQDIYIDRQIEKLYGQIAELEAQKNGR